MSKKNIKWSHELRVALYKELVNFFGEYDATKFGKRGKPVGMSKADYLDHLDVIGQLIGVGIGKGGAISNQIAWCFASPFTKACHLGHVNNAWNNINAALEAGWMSPYPPAKPKPGFFKDCAENDQKVAESPKQEGWFKKAVNKVKSWFS